MDEQSETEAFLRSVIELQTATITMQAGVIARLRAALAEQGERVAEHAARLTAIERQVYHGVTTVRFSEN